MHSGNKKNEQHMNIKTRPILYFGMQYQQIDIKRRQQTEILTCISAMKAPKYSGNLNCFLSKLTIHNSLDSSFEPERIEIEKIAHTKAKRKNKNVNRPKLCWHAQIHNRIKMVD